MKYCIICGVDKCEKEFGKDSKAKDGLFSGCKKCTHVLEKLLYQNQYNRKNPEKKKAHSLARVIPLRGLCEVCKKRKARHRHHPNYLNPLGVMLVCAICHSRLHKENNQAIDEMLNGLAKEYKK
jgi:hypothetical protein